MLGQTHVSTTMIFVLAFATLDLLYSAIVDGENIDRQHLRPPVLAILLETLKGKN